MALGNFPLPGIMTERVWLGDGRDEKSKEEAVIKQT
jgi:hypothetical protein